MKHRTFPHQKPSKPRRRRGRTRLFVLSAAVAASSALVPKPALAQAADSRNQAVASVSQHNRMIRFEIEAGTIETVAAAFERQTGLDVDFTNPELGMIQSPGVSGLLTIEEAMRQLLAGTSVTATFSDAGVSLGVGGVAEFVEVTGRGTASVSSPKYVVPLRDIAQTIALIPRTVIEEQGATTLSEALRNVPGITLQAGEGGGASNTAGDMFTMRGFNASNSLFVDGVRDDGLIARDVFNVEQVEVFMGPTGSDVGRGTAAGYVNIQTKTPHLGSSQSVVFGYGSADQTRLTADFNISPATQGDTWLSRTAVRFNTLWQHSGVPGRDVVELESKGVAPSIAFGLDTPTRVTVAAQILRQDNLPDYGIPGAAWEDEPLTPTTVQAARAVDQRNYYGSTAYDFDRASQDSVTTRVEHDVNRRLTLRNQTRFNKTHREAVVSTIQNVSAFDPATNFVTIARQGNERENKVVSNQTSLVSRFTTGRLRHASSIGVEYSLEQQFAPTLTGVGTRAPVDIFNPDPEGPVSGFAPARTSAYSKGRSNTIGFYAFDSVELSSRWQLSGGARWDYYDTRFEAVDASGATTTDLTAADGVISGKLGLLYRVSEGGNVYFSYGTSVTPPGNANFALSAQANNQNNPSVKPQESSNIELGTKWDFAGGRLSLTGSAFHTRNTNVIFTVDATAVPPIYNQDDGQFLDGVMLGAMGRITSRWEVLANFGYLDTELQSQNAANNGRRLTLTPAFSSSFWTTYELLRGLTIGGGVRHTSDVFVNAANTIRSPGYHIVDALVEYALNAHLTLRVNMYNATDETYIRSINNNGGRYNPGHPRSASVTSHVTF